MSPPNRIPYLQLQRLEPYAPLHKSPAGLPEYGVLLRQSKAELATALLVSHFCFVWLAARKSRIECIRVGTCSRIAVSAWAATTSCHSIGWSYSLRDRKWGSPLLCCQNALHFGPWRESCSQRQQSPVKGQPYARLKLALLPRCGPRVREGLEHNGGGCVGSGELA